MILLSLLVAHFIGDFLFQTDWMAKNKSNDIKALVAHTWVYSLCFLPWGATFWVITWLTHFFTDAITSRITSRLWFFKKINTNCSKCMEAECWSPSVGNRHYFFVVIGLDQLIHYGTLAWTLRILS